MTVFWKALFSTSLIFCVLTAFAQPEIQQVATDQTPPVLHHETVRRVIEGQSLTLSVRASDDTGLDRVRLLYRVDALSAFQETLFLPRATDRYEVTLGSTELREPRVDYYIEAIDRAGNVTALGNELTPLVVAVTSPVRESDRWGWKKILGTVVAAAAVGYMVKSKDSPPAPAAAAGSASEPSIPGTSGEAEVTLIGVAVPGQ